jgi:hypothetical protein
MPLHRNHKLGWFGTFQCFNDPIVGADGGDD